MKLNNLAVYTAGLCLALGGPLLAVPDVYVNDYQSFLSAAGAVHEIDFETLPNGAPSVDGQLITAGFNYTAEGVHFFPSIPELVITANPVMGFDLTARDPLGLSPSLIVAELQTPARAVGIFFSGETIFSVINAAEEIITTVTITSPDAGSFVGVVSDEPILFTTNDGGLTDSIEAFVFAPVPEPGTLAILAAGALVCISRVHRERRLRRASGRDDGSAGTSLSGD